MLRVSKTTRFYSVRSWPKYRLLNHLDDNTKDSTQWSLTKLSRDAPHHFQFSSYSFTVVKISQTSLRKTGKERIWQFQNSAHFQLLSSIWVWRDWSWIGSRYLSRPSSGMENYINWGMARGCYYFLFLLTFQIHCELLEHSSNFSYVSSTYGQQLLMIIQFDKPTSRIADKQAHLKNHFSLQLVCFLLQVNGGSRQWWVAIA